MHPLDRAVLNVWRLKLGMVAGVATLGTLAYEVLNLFDGDLPLPFGLTTALVLAAGLALCLIVPPLRYRFWRYALRPEELYLERGLFNRVRTIVPLRRIQHLDVSQDVIEREFGLGRLVVHTAGARSSEIVLPGLRYEEAEKLRDAMKRYILEEDVV
ncbi:PH domain-containing protein [Rhodocaloribacter litoris]|uniref:PH domain-containing protein n=1 Tax=Rhodocaloribacter litoris TaxID=2558931 RepID=UPI00142006F6|nr:PH domain-containing protein [Rhodocaloribacter litoris]QXD14618.1 PH domain-containing protein [Rhodocaloribacter litoris]